MARNFTRSFTPAQPPLYEWLVLVGDECIMYWLRMSVPCEDAVRRTLCIPEDIPILIGRP